VLSVLLAKENGERFDLVALSGTSGGAMCATLAWSALISGDGDRGVEAANRLQAFWDDLKADEPFDAALNSWGLFTARLPVVAEISPYAYAPFAQRELTRALRDYARLGDFPADATRSNPFLFVAATEILEGVTKHNSVFRGETITIDQVVASAAIPPVPRHPDRREALLGRAVQPQPADPRLHRHRAEGAPAGRDLDYPDQSPEA
jgi:NTE family protein